MTDFLTDMPAWLSIVPPLIAIICALVFREVLSALILSVISGGIIIAYYEGGFVGSFGGLLSPIDYIVEAVSPSNGDSGHISVILFSLLIGGMVSLITANGSMNALVNKIAKRATSKRRGQFVTWLMGLIIFFDDFANTMVVGNTMRPLTDKLKISREKLAYIVDSTAAPIAAMALVTTWIGAELQFISDGVKGLTDFPTDVSAYTIFLGSLKYSFYPVLTLAFILIIIITKKDFGPMLEAEQNIKEPIASKETQQHEGKIWKGVLPIVIMLLATILGLFYTGYDASILGNSDLSFTKKIALIIGAADSYKALLWASYASLAIALVTSIPQMGLESSVESIVSGFKKMLPAVIILILAWSLAGVTERMHTADFISQSVLGHVSPVILPMLTFIVAAIVAFSTGSSWGTMAILYPVIIASSWALGREAGLDTASNYAILLNVISCVLAGSVLGDHCSPISDTTILSSLASECDHLAHVRTQMPYALVVGLVSVSMGTLMSSLGVPVWLCFVASLSILYGIVSYFGKTSQ